MRSETREIAAPADFELSRPRNSRLTYLVSWDETRPARGLVFVIPGFGGDGNAGYAKALREHVAREGFVAVSVDYHCLGARPEIGAQVSVVKGEHAKLLGTAQLLGLPVNDPHNIDALTRLLAAHVAAVGGELRIRGEIAPTRGEYQNFGILQAMDHLAVLGDIVARGPEFDQSAIVAFGSSHGGYIAHLMAKIAPRSLSAVFDNSAYTQPPFGYLGLGLGREYVTQYNGIGVDCEIRSGWTMANRYAANAYTRDADLIRDVGYVPHVTAMRLAGGAPLFRMVNAARDGVSPPELKLRQVRALRAAGFDARLDIIDDAQIDGVVFKQNMHGLDASLGKLFDRWIGEVGHRTGSLDCASASVIDYACVDRGYRFTHSSTAPYIAGAVFDLFAVDAADATLARSA
jgi:hypothetical protein